MAVRYGFLSIVDNHGQELIVKTFFLLFVISTLATDGFSDPKAAKDSLQRRKSLIEGRSHSLNSLEYNFSYERFVKVPPRMFSQPRVSDARGTDGRLARLYEAGVVVVRSKDRQLFIDRKVLEHTGQLDDGTTKSALHLSPVRKRTWISKSGAFEITESSMNDVLYGEKISTTATIAHPAIDTGVIRELQVLHGMRIMGEVSDKYTVATETPEEITLSTTSDNGTSTLVIDKLTSAVLQNRQAFIARSGKAMVSSQETKYLIRRNIPFIAKLVDIGLRDSEHEPSLVITLLTEPVFGSKVPDVPPVPAFYIGMDQTVDPPVQLNSPYQRGVDAARRPMKEDTISTETVSW